MYVCVWVCGYVSMVYLAFRCKFHSHISEVQCQTLIPILIISPLLYATHMQTNVYDGAQRRKINYFEGFVKKAVVVVPPHHILRQRTAKRNSEMGQPVPEDAINAMKGERAYKCSCMCWGERERERERVSECISTCDCVGGCE